MSTEKIAALRSRLFRVKGSEHLTAATDAHENLCTAVRTADEVSRKELLQLAEEQIEMAEEAYDAL